MVNGGGVGRAGRRGTGSAGAAGPGGSDSTGSSSRTAASRARAPSAGTPFTLTSSSYTPVLRQRQAVARAAAQRHREPHRHLRARGELAGQRR